MMCTVLEKSRREDREERQKDHKFFLELGKRFANNN